VNPNNLALYILRRLLKNENLALLLYFVDERIDNIKDMEKKFVLLEMYLNLAVLLNSKEIFYSRLLPNMLKPIIKAVKEIIEHFARLE